MVIHKDWLGMFDRQSLLADYRHRVENILSLEECNEIIRRQEFEARMRAYNPLHRTDEQYERDLDAMCAWIDW